MDKTNIFDDFLQESLAKRHDAGLLRQLVFTEGLIDFASNDYLGFAQEPSFDLCFPTDTFIHGSTGSRLITGKAVRPKSVNNSSHSPTTEKKQPAKL